MWAYPYLSYGRYNPTERKLKLTKLFYQKSNGQIVRTRDGRGVVKEIQGSQIELGKEAALRLCKALIDWLTKEQNMTTEEIFAFECDI